MDWAFTCYSRTEVKFLAFLCSKLNSIKFVELIFTAARYVAKATTITQQLQGRHRFERSLSTHSLNGAVNVTAMDY